MQITERKLIEDLQVALAGEQSYVDFFEKKDNDSWGVWPNKINFFPKETEMCDEISMEKFLADVKGKELQAIYYEEGMTPGMKLKDMKQLIDFFGIEKMEVLGAKVPKVIASRFQYFASIKEKNTSEVLRGLIYDYVREEMKDNAGILMFRREQDYLQ